MTKDELVDAIQKANNRKTADHASEVHSGLTFRAPNAAPAIDRRGAVRHS